MKLIFTPKPQTPVQKAISNKLNFQKKPIVPSKWRSNPKDLVDKGTADDNTA